MDEAEGLRVLHTHGPRGVGVLTLRARRAGEVLHHFTGEVGAELRQHSLQVAPGLHISGTRLIGYLSHACEPNCRLDMAASTLVALRDVEADVLLTIDYAQTEDVLYRQFACHCGAATCRRWITGRAEAPNAEGRQFLESVS